MATAKHYTPRGLEASPSQTNPKPLRTKKLTLLESVVCLGLTAEKPYLPFPPGPGQGGWRGYSSFPDEEPEPHRDEGEPTSDSGVLRLDDAGAVFP